MTKVFLICAVIPITLLAQAKTGDIKVTGSCNAVATGNSNQINVTCNGLSREKADDIVKLMNTILDRQMDPKKLFGELDKIYGAVNDINASLRPLANAPPELLTRIKQGDQLRAECSQFLTDWSEEATSSTGNVTKQLQTALDDPTLGSLKETDKKFAEHYLKDLAPQLGAVQEKLMPTATVNWTNVRSATLMGIFCQTAHNMATRYSATPRPDPSLVTQSQAVANSCTTFQREWMLAEREARDLTSRAHDNLAALKPSLNVGAAVERVNVAEVARYKQILEPKLAAWRADNLRHVPDTQVKDYDSVKDQLQMAAVCRDFGTVVQAYQTKVMEDLRKNSGARNDKK